MKEEWKEKLQRSLADFEESAPEGLWNSIEKAMSEDTHVIGKDNEHPNKPRIIILRTLAAAACIATGLGIFLTINNSNDGNGETAKSYKQTNDNKETKPYNLQEEDTPRLLAKVDNVTSTHHRNTESTVQQEAFPEPSSEVAAPLQTTNDEDMEVKADGLETSRQSVVIKKTTRTAGTAYNEEPQHTALTKTRKSRPDISKGDGSRLTASLFAGNSIGKSDSPVGGMVLADAVQSNILMMSSMPDMPDGSNMKEYYVGKASDEHVDHHQPIRAGLSVRYALTSRIGIETGITYSYLSSDISKGSNANRYETSQKLHFIGIPLNVDYSAWKSRWLNVYVSAGGMAEKNIKGKSTTDYLLNNKRISTTENKQKMKELQWSANAALGLQLNIAKGIGIYAEPGVGYYFSNGSSIKTAYSEKPFNFNLKFGLRYSFNQQ